MQTRWTSCSASTPIGTRMRLRSWPPQRARSSSRRRSPPAGWAFGRRSGSRCGRRRVGGFGRSRGPAPGGRVSAASSRRRASGVLEVDRPRRLGRSSAKSDPLDAIRAARTALAGERLPEPRSAGKREELRALVTAREGALRAKRAGLCQLRALIVTAPRAAPHGAARTQPRPPARPTARPAPRPRQAPPPRPPARAQIGRQPGQRAHP